MSLLLPLHVPAADPTAPTVTSGKGSPQGIVAAPKGSLYLRRDGGATTSLYVKTSGASTSKTGWSAK